jgi:phosphate transport system substrate-binding protein
MGLKNGIYGIGALLLLGLPLWWQASSDALAEHAGASTVAGTVPDIASYNPTQAVSGTLTIGGSDTMQPLLARLVSAFRQWSPDAKIAIQGGGSDAATEAFISQLAASRRGDGNTRGHLGSNTIMMLAASRPFTSHETDEFRSRFGYEPMEVPIALDAVAVYVNKANPIQELSLDQVDAIFGIARKRGAHQGIATWGQLGLHDGWEQKPINIYGRDKRSGTRTFFKQIALLDGDFKPEIKEEPGSASEILAIARDPLAIGYAGIGFQSSLVRTIPLTEKPGMPSVRPTAVSAGDGSYPLSRHLYLYVNKVPKEPLNPMILEFLRFINSREGQSTVGKAGVFPLPSSQVARNLEMLVGPSVSAAAGAEIRAN